LYGELMSRIGKKPIAIPQGVKVEQDGRCVKVSGPLGTLQMDCHQQIKVKIDNADKQVIVENEHPENREARQLHGTMRALIANMVAGVSKGYEKKMEVYGTGYSVKEKDGKLVLQVGFCNPVEVKVPKGIKIKIETGVTKGDETPAKFTLSGADKFVLGQLAADVRRIRPPEPYKGKGIRYADEHVKRKVGKTFTSGTV
jgi:large subunit ribosomal protein L6